MRPILLFNHVAGIPGDQTIETLALLDDFSACASRFGKTYQQFPAKHPHDLIIVVSNGPADLKLKTIYADLDCEFLEYKGEGWDIGSYQWAINHLPNECEFVVCMCARTYFNRAGWLKRFMDAREKHGEGLYSSMASYEACPLTPENKPNPHLRTAFFGMNPRAFKGYPNKVESREDSFAFESGEWGITNWFLQQNKPVKMVTWAGDFDAPDWRKAANIFRKGTQANLIALDRHSAVYENANDEDKKFLQTIADGGTPE